MEQENAALLPAPATVKQVLLAAALCLMSVIPAAGDDDLRSLELFNGTGAEVVSGNRSPRPASQTAENITVVTADEIEGLNAHTLVDILYAVTGVQLEMNRTPGTVANIEVQGSGFDHVLVLIDNVAINNLTDNFPDLASVPVQMIERIEIVKGAASSSWGSALGGVINVITKFPEQERAFGGTVSASLGSRETADGRAEVSGAKDRFGYYLSGGRLRSDGLLPNNEAGLSNFYGKLRYDLPVRGAATLTTLFTDNASGQLAVPSANVDQESRQLISSLSLQLPLANRLTLDAALRTRHSTSEVFVRQADTGALLQSLAGDDDGSGGSLKLSWLGEWQTVVAGVDYDHVGNSIKVRGVGAKNRADRIGVYLNDTVTLGAFAVTPSARYDHTGFGKHRFSPSLGITYALGENSVLRGYSARGYSLTSLNRSDATEKVWTSQLGFETGEVPYLWLKGTLFRNDTWDILSNVHGTLVEQRQLKQGIELEARTLPLLNTSLSAGYTFINATEGENGPVLAGIPKHTVKVGLRYQDESDLHAELIGNYIHWNVAAGKYGAMIYDLHLRKTFQYSEYGSLELFGSVRNLLNDEQYLTGFYRNTGRWAEAGVRCNF